MPGMSILTTATPGINYAVTADGRTSYAANGTAFNAQAGVADAAGNLYLIGGASGAASSNRCLLYDIVGNTWTTKATKTSAARNIAAVNIAGVIYCLGGWTGSAVLNKNEAYNVAGNSWSTLTAPGAIMAAVAVAIGNIIYLCQGTTDGSASATQLKTYDVTNDAGGWTTKTACTEARYSHVGAALGGNVYVSCGYKSATPARIKTTEKYDVVGNSWTSKASAPGEREGAGWTVANDLLYACCGNDNTGVRTATTYRYDYLTNTWTTMTAFPTSVRAYSSLTHIRNGVMIHACGTTTSSVQVNDTHGYIDYQGAMTTAPITGNASAGNSLTNHTTSSSGVGVAVTSGDIVGFQVNAWDSAPANKTTFFV